MTTEEAVKVVEDLNMATLIETSTDDFEQTVKNVLAAITRLNDCAVLLGSQLNEAQSEIIELQIQTIKLEAELITLRPIKEYVSDYDVLDHMLDQFGCCSERDKLLVKIVADLDMTVLEGRPNIQRYYEEVVLGKPNDREPDPTIYCAKLTGPTS